MDSGKKASTASDATRDDNPTNILAREVSFFSPFLLLLSSYCTAALEIASGEIILPFAICRLVPQPI